MKTWTKGIVTGLLAGVVSLGSLPAVAGPYDSYINRQEMAQEHRIHQGLYSGRLSPGEFRRLENQQARIRATEAQMRADGRLTRGEKTQLAQMQERANRNIYRYKHNNYGPASYRPASYRPAHYRPVNWRAGWR
jgi:hypothetical protein